MRTSIQHVRILFRKYIPRDFVGLSFLRRTVQWFLTHAPWLQKRGISVTIGGYGSFRIEPRLIVGKYDYEGCGKEHNAGFEQWIEACRGKKTVFDIGAHIGLYALPISRVVHAAGRIYCFEPAEQNVVALRHHINYNALQNIEVLPYLVGERNATSVPFFERIDDVEGMNAIVIKKNPDRFTKTVKEQISLDAFCDARGLIPEVVKIDVEGAELFVLRGAERVLADARPLIFW